VAHHLCSPGEPGSAGSTLVSSSTRTRRKQLRINDTGFNGPDALLLTQPASKHSVKLKVLASSFFIYHWTPEGGSVVPFMVALQRQLIKFKLLITDKMKHLKQHSTLLKVI